MLFIDLEDTKVPSLGFGTWQLKDDACTDAVKKALEIGYRHIDTAQIYENEAAVGRALKESGVPRQDIFLTTKIWMTNLRDEDMRRSFDESLKHLQTDYADLLLIHWPVTTEVPFEEQMKSLEKLRREKKARRLGLSNFTVPQMEETVEKMKAPLVNNQVEYHPFLSQKPVLEFLRRHDMFLTAYSPLARGKVQEEPALKEIAKRLDKTPGQVALRWLVQQERVAAIPKAASEKHMRENFDIFNFELSAEDMQKIFALTEKQGRLIDPEWAPRWDKAA